MTSLALEPDLVRLLSDRWPVVARDLPAKAGRGVGVSGLALAALLAMRSHGHEVSMVGLERLLGRSASSRRRLVEARQELEGRGLVVRIGEGPQTTYRAFPCLAGKPDPPPLPQDPLPSLTAGVAGVLRQGSEESSGMGRSRDFLAMEPTKLRTSEEAAVAAAGVLRHGSDAESYVRGSDTVFRLALPPELESVLLGLARELLGRVSQDKALVPQGDRGFVHRDVKPENVLEVSPEEEIAIAERFAEAKDNRESLKSPDRIRQLVIEDCRTQPGRLASYQARAARRREREQAEAQARARLEEERQRVLAEREREPVPAKSLFLTFKPGPKLQSHEDLARGVSSR